jgi:Domain of unknown function (DUF4259)
MGTLGTGPFENDDALDFLDSLEDADADKRPRRVADALRRVVGTTDYLEAPLMAEAVAAAAVVAGSADPDAVAGEPYLPVWLDEEPLEVDEGLADLATQALHRALRHDDNEWWELWDEAEATDEVTDVVSRYLSVFEL